MPLDVRVEAQGDGHTNAVSWVVRSHDGVELHQAKHPQPVVSLLWNESKLVFVCPVTCREVECGPHGDGYRC